MPWGEFPNAPFAASTPCSANAPEVDAASCAPKGRLGAAGHAKGISRCEPAGSDQAVPVCGPMSPAGKSSVFFRAAIPGSAGEYVVLMGSPRSPRRESERRSAGRGQDLQRRARQRGRHRDARSRRARASRNWAKPPRRSLMFIANTAEEKGLLGSYYFAPSSDVVSIGQYRGRSVDLDMPLLLYDFTDIVAFGADHSTVGAAVADAIASQRHQAVARPRARSRCSFVRSDHYSFVKAGVPAVSLDLGAGGARRRKRPRISSPTTITASATT